MFIGFRSSAVISLTAFLLTAHADGQPVAHETATQVNSSLSPLSVFEDVWKEAKANIYPVEREVRFFTERAYRRLKRKAARARDVEDLADTVINPFLDQLRVSHTQFYTEAHPDYYMLRSLFSTHDISAPKIHHVGMQLAKREHGYTVRSVLEGYPAHRVGIRRGDVIRSADGLPFHPVRSFAPRPNRPAKLVLRIDRNGRDLFMPVTPVYESIHESYLRAMTNSARILDYNDRKIGYVHLWTGTDDVILEEFSRIIFSEFSDVDALILDLRDGMGGAWYNYLDPFFPDRDGFFVATRIDRLGVRAEQPVPGVPVHRYFSKPMIVLINEGVRSGKESLAYQFKKSGRARLVGVTTAGAFCAGKSVFSEVDRGYILYLAVGELLLDGTTVEGRGIDPDIGIPYPLAPAQRNDPQLAKAIELLAGGRS